MNYNIKTFSNFDFVLENLFDEEIELFVDTLPSHPKKCKRVLWVAEPNEVSKLRNDILKRKNEFDLILSWDEEILKNCENSVLHPYGTTWIQNFDFDSPKKFVITTIIGCKTFLEGHFLRQKLPFALVNNKVLVQYHTSINCPPNISIPNNYVMKDKNLKNEVFYGQFHICIENVQRNNYFSEKLVDCFQTKTVPIYYGAKNIGNFFNQKGIFSFSNLEELITICNSLNENTYNEMKSYVEENYNISKKYSDYKKLIYDQIKTKLK